MDNLKWQLLIALPMVHFLLPPASAQEPKETQPTAFEVLLNEGKRLSGQGKYYDAAILFHKILDGGDESQPYYQEAQYEMGVALFQAGLYVAAFNYLDAVAAAGPDHIRYRHALPLLVQIHEKLPGERSALYRMASYPVEFYPPQMADLISFLTGRFHYYEGNLDKALEFLARVSPTSPDTFARAMYLKGVVHVRLNQAKEATDAFEQALSAIRLNRDKVREAKHLEEMTLMALARVSYGDGKYWKAIEYYDQIPDDSDQWLESLFEKSWAYFQAKQYARALGNIQTVNSPYFEEEFYPEAHILQAVIFFKNCHYEEALETIDPFYKEYYAVLKELEGILKAQTDPAAFYQYLAAISVRGGEYSLKVKKIFNAALADKRVRSLFGFVVQINREINQLEQLRKHPVASRLVDVLLPDVMAYRSLTISEAGRLAQQRLVRVQRDLKGLLSQALRIRFETLNAQKGIIGEAVEREMVKKGKSTEVVPTDFEHVRWPFDGEYWKDELGSYYYPLESLCK